MFFLYLKWGSQFPKDHLDYFKNSPPLNEHQVLKGDKCHDPTSLNLVDNREGDCNQHFKISSVPPT